ncbi:MAG: hypothetical protein R2705_13190 [Ilumatobacteraceae bacterium]
MHYTDVVGAHATLVGALVTLAVGSLVLVPSLYALYRFAGSDVSAVHGPDEH